jgi:hypothetical protein
MKIPDNVNLPYFAYGLFKPNEPAHHTISQYLIETPKPRTINGIGFWIRDGLPVADLNRPDQLEGVELGFKPELQTQAYETICNFISAGDQGIYTWGELKIEEITLNILVGKEPQKGSIESDTSNWTAKTDPLFTIAMEMIQQKIDGNALQGFVEKPFAWDRFFELLMSYQLLWSSIERHCSFTYGLMLKPSDKRHEMAKSVEFQKYLKQVLREHVQLHQTDTIYHSHSLDDGKRLDADRPIYSIDYYYYIRNNLAHRGKSEWRDGDIIRIALIELHRIFKLILNDTLVNNPQ